MAKIGRIENGYILDFCGYLWYFTIGWESDDFLVFYSESLLVFRR